MKPHRSHPHRINHTIRAEKVLLLGTDRKPIGTFTVPEALGRARVLGTDLIEIAPKANPPVCLLGDYGRFLFQFQKQDRHDNHRPKLKEIQLSATISEHDMDIKAAHARNFLQEKHPVKVILCLRGREKAHPEIGEQQMQTFIHKLGLNHGQKIQHNGSTFLSFIQPS